MLLTIQRVLILKSVSIFAEVPDEHLIELAVAMRERTVHGGDTVIAEGDEGNALFVIVAGGAEVARRGRTLVRLGEREVFGELAALDPEPRSATVRAIGPTRLLELSHRDLDAALARDADIMRGIIRMLCRRLRATGALMLSE